MIRTFALLFTLLSCAICLIAQNQTEDDPKLGNISGVVVEGKTGEPVRKALVLARHDPSSAIGATTDGSGKFSFRRLEPGAYTLSVEKEGWSASRDSKALATTVTAGQTTSDVKLKLLKAAVISGRVVDSEGDPLAGVAVQVHAEPAKKAAGAGAWASSNDRGEYRAFHVAPGHYRICATYSARPRPDVKMQPAATAAYPKVCYPGTTQGSVVSVEAGTELQGIDFRIVAARGVAVRGRVIASSVEKPTFLMVNLQALEGGNSIGAPALVKDTDGKFEMQGVLPGRYRLSVAGGNFNGPSGFRTSRTIEVAEADLEGVDLIVGPPRNIDGRVVVPEGRKPPPLVVVLASREPGDTQAGGFAEVSTAGTFSFNQVGGGEYDVALAINGPADDLYVGAIRLGDSDALVNGVRSDIPGDMEIVLKANGATVNCAVTNDQGQPVTAGHVILIPDAPRERQLALMGDCRTDAKGACSILGITPGEYHVYAFAGEMELDQRDPNAYKPYEKFGKAVKVAEGDRVDVALKVAKEE